MRRVIVFQLLFFALFPVLLHAHAKQTHVNIAFTTLQYLARRDPLRPDALILFSDLREGAVLEDNFIFLPIGRFYFHFLPFLNSPPPPFGLGVHAGCDAIEWGITGASCGASTPFSFISPRINDHGWPQAIGATCSVPGQLPPCSTPAVDQTTFQPTHEGWRHLGYVIHLLEDMTSPPHVRNSAHPPAGPFGDPFEPDNQQAMVNLPLHDYVDLSGVQTPQEIFKRVADYTRHNYFSEYTIFQSGLDGPSIAHENGYFYANCLAVSDTFNRDCDPVAGIHYRKIAQKQGPSAPPTIDDTIAHEQFAELGPVAVQAVAALIKMYAPVLKVTVAPGSGTGTVTLAPAGKDCTTSCSEMVVNGTEVTITASPATGSVFTRWDGDCSSGGSASSLTLRLYSDHVCTALFDSVPTCPPQTVCGTVRDQAAQPLPGIVIELFNWTGQFLASVKTDQFGNYSFRNLTDPKYLVHCLNIYGFCGPFQDIGVPGGAKVNFSAYAPATVNITGPSGSFILFTQRQWSGPPPSPGPQSIEGVAPDTFFIAGTWWLTCYLPPSYAQTSSQPLSLQPQQTVTLACPP